MNGKITSNSFNCVNFNLIDVLLCRNYLFDKKRYEMAISTKNSELAPEISKLTDEAITELYSDFAYYISGVKKNRFIKDGVFDKDAYIKERDNFNKNVGIYLASKFTEYSKLKTIFTDPAFCTMIGKKLSEDLEIYAKYIEKVNQKQIEQDNKISELEKKLEIESLKKNIWQVVVKDLTSFLGTNSDEKVLDFIGTAQVMYENLERYINNPDIVNDPEKFNALKQFCDLSLQELEKGIPEYACVVPIQGTEEEQLWVRSELEKCFPEEVKNFKMKNAKMTQ